MGPALNRGRTTTPQHQAIDGMDARLCSAEALVLVVKAVGTADTTVKAMKCMLSTLSKAGQQGGNTFN